MREGVKETFDRFSAEYDARFPRLIPRYLDFHAVIVQRAAEHEHARAEADMGGAPSEAPWVDLGCGTGELSRKLLEALPEIRLHAVDLSPAMIERARAKLARWEGRVTFAVGDFLTTPLPRNVPGAVSALAVHHLDGREKRIFFGRLLEALSPGGIFVLGDAVNGGSREYTAYYIRRWADHMRASGMDEDEIAHVLDDHDRNDRFSTLGEHFQWLSGAGFREVECLWKHFLLFVMAAERPLKGSTDSEKISGPRA